MQMGAGAAAGISRISDDGAALDFLAGMNVHLGEVGVKGGDVITVINGDAIAPAGFIRGGEDGAVGGGFDGCARGGHDVNAVVEFNGFGVEGVGPIAKS